MKQIKRDDLLKQGTLESVFRALGSHDQASMFDVREDGSLLSSKQEAFIRDLILSASRASLYSDLRSQYLDFVQEVYRNNYALISKASRGKIVLEGFTGKKDFRTFVNATSLTDGGVDGFDVSPEIEKAVREFEQLDLFSQIEDPQEETSSLRNEPNNPYGVRYAWVEDLDGSLDLPESPKKERLIAYFLEKAYASGITPAYLLSNNIPLVEIFPSSYPEFSAYLKNTISKSQLERLEGYSEQDRQLIENFRSALPELLEKVYLQKKRIFGFMTSLKEVAGVLELNGSSFFFTNTLSSESQQYFLSDYPKVIEAYAKDAGFSVEKLSKQAKVDSPSFDETVGDSMTLDGLDSESLFGASDEELKYDKSTLEKSFVFDGNVRVFSETVWGKDELKEYKKYLESGLKKEADAYKEKLAKKKEEIIERYGEEGIKKDGIDVGLKAIEELESEGVFSVIDQKRKVFSEVPQEIKDIAKELNQVDPVKTSWNDPEDEQAQILFKKAVKTMKWAISNARVQLAYSGGKDSTILAFALFKAIKENKKEGIPNYPARIISSDTLLENPEITNNLHLDHEAFATWAKANDIDLECHIAVPSLTSQYQVAQVGGRKLHNMPTKGSECSQDWKITPMSELRKAWRKEINGEPIITVTGTRMEESIHRGNAMKQREDSDEKITVSDKNELIMSPIASMTSNHVFKLLDVHLVGEVDMQKQDGLTQKDWAYPTDGKRTQRIYSDSSSSSCELVNAQVGSTKGAGCGARTGCWGCQRVKNDTSAENMLKKTPASYVYMAPLLRYRKWVSDTHDDPANRNYIGRTINEDGLIAFGHDNYHPSYLQQMLRYLLTMQIEHDQIVSMQRQANPNKEYPDLKIFDLNQLVAVQYEWSRYGRESGRAFEAFRIYDEIYNKGARYYPPVLTPEETAHIKPLTSSPKNGYIKVGTPFKDFHPDNFEPVPEHGWTSLDEYNRGLRDMALELSSFDSSEVNKTSRSEKTGTVSTHLADIDSANKFEVDPRGVKDLLHYELPRLLDESTYPNIIAGYAAKVLLQYGVVVPHNAREHHALIAQYQFLETKKLTPATYDHSECLSRLVDENGNRRSDVDAFRVETYYAEPLKVQAKIAEHKELLGLLGKKNEKGQSICVELPDEKYKKVKRAAIQESNDRVLLEVNSVIKQKLESACQERKLSLFGKAKEILDGVGNCQSTARALDEMLAKVPLEKILSNDDAMNKIADICSRGLEVENDFAGFEIMRRMKEEREVKFISKAPQQVSFESISLGS